jgi:hypothetical protein
MTWNYRVIHRNDDPTLLYEDVYAIHEVYYEDDVPVSMAVDPSCPQGETIEELREDLEHYRTALDKPILEATKFGDTGWS